MEVPSTERTAEYASTIRSVQRVPLISLQRRQLVGHDILLARHGNHICSMRVDRGSGRVIALLDDGSVDSAPNLISPDLHLPETLRSVLREDRKFFGIVSAVTVVVGGLFFATCAGMAASMAGNPEMAELLLAYSYAY
jgi:hypothetical protein